MAKMLAKTIIDIPDEDDDEDFLRELDAAESQALSLSSSVKRRRMITPSTITNPNSQLPEPQEGAYTAALRGSKSLTWQNQLHSPSSHVSNNSEVTPRAVTGGGACYKCGKEGHWARDCNVSASPLATEVGMEKECPCGMGSCLMLTANTERNRGRKFYRCPVRQENGGCGFFEWCDESSGKRTSVEERAWKSGSQQQSYQPSATQVTSTFTKSWKDDDSGPTYTRSTYGAVQNFESTDSKGYGTKTSSSCFKCGGEGHWARDCPTSSSNISPGVVGKSSSGACYKCGQSGHWARDCSQGQTTKVRNW